MLRIWSPGDARAAAAAALRAVLGDPVREPGHRTPTRSRTRPGGPADPSVGARLASEAFLGRRETLLDRSDDRMNRMNRTKISRAASAIDGGRPR
jgi:hypothetical protein